MKNIFTHIFRICAKSVYLGAPSLPQIFIAQSKFAVMAVLLLFTGIAFTHAQTGALIFAEEFTSSTAGDTVAWSRINAGTATSGNTLLVANTSPLSSPVSNYNGGGGNYASSTPPTSTGSGFVKCKSTSGFSSSNYYTFYYSFLVNIAAGSGSTQQYYFGLSNGVNTNYFARVFAKKINATTYNLGMTKNSASPVTYATSSTSLTYGTTYLIVVKYAMVSGATNDTAALWINPSITSRPTMASAEVIVPTTDADVTTMTSVSFFHRTVNSGDPTNFSFDGVRLAYGLGTNQDSVAWSVLGAYAPPAITSNPSNSTICTGSNTSFVVAASGSPTSYQWQRSTTGTGGTYSNITSGSMDGGVTYSGFTTATLTLTSATTSVTGYAYRATATNVGGTSSPSSGALLTVNALPTAYTVTGGGAYCSGGAGVAVGLSNSQSGVNYQLKRGGSPVGSPVAGSTGNPISFGLQTTAGTYTVEATNTSTSCVNTMTGSVSVTIDSPPSAPAAITGTFTVCGGGASTTNLFDATAGGTWSSSNTSQATVDASGVVTGLATGTPTISYTVTSGTCSLSATQVVTVTAAPSAGTITGGTSVCVSNTLNLSDTASGGSWSSSTPSVATVNSSGQVTGVAAGTTTITYTVTSGCTAIATQLITVTNPPSAGTITGSSTVCDNSTTPLTNGVGGGVWTSSNTSIATVGSTSGTVTGVAAGSVTITYTVTTGCSAFTTFGMTVDAAPILSVISGSNSVCAGATTPLTDTATGGTWSTSDATKATVGSSSGIVTGVAAGSVTISYSKTVSSCTSVVTYGMTVNTVPATPGAISGTTTVCLGNTSPLTNGTSGGTWTSSNTSVATIGSSSGSVTSVAAGTSVISYTVSNGCGASLPATTTFTVNALPTAVISNSDTILYGGNDTVIFTGTANATCYYNIDGGSTLSATLNASGTVKIYTAPSANSTFNLTSVQSTAGCTTTLSGQSATITLDSGFMAYYEDFTNYTQNATVTTNTNWVFITGSGTNGDQITTDTGTTLTSPIAYYNGGSGKYIRYFRSSSASNNVRARRVNGPGITSNTIYYSALIRVLTTPTDSIFYFGLTPSVPNTNYFAKVFIKTSGTNLFKLGISKSAANGTFGTTSLSTNVTYLVLVKYTVVPGSSNDSVSLWVNPVISTEPTSATAEATDFSGSDFSIANNLGFFFRSTGTANGTLKFDALRLAYGINSAKAWTKLAAYNPPPAPTITTDPIAATICSGGNTSFSVVATNPTTYQWQRSTTGTGGTYSNITSSSMDGGVTYSGFTTATLTLTSASSGIDGYAYRCVVTNVSGSTPSNGSLLTANALPTAQTVTATGSGAYCSGSSGSTISLTNSQSGVNYQLKLGASNVGSPVAGSGTTLSLGTYTTTGTYSVTAVNTSTTCTNNMTGSVTLSVNSLPTAYTVTGGGAYCSGGSGVAVGLSNSQTGVNYQLKVGGSPVGSPVAGTTGSAISFGLQTTAGSYTVEATNTSTGCVNTMTGSVNVTIDSPPATPSAITGTFTQCMGSTYALFNSTSGGTWSSSNTSLATINPTSGSTTALAAGSPTISYTVTSGTCSVSVTQALTIPSVPHPGTVTGTNLMCVGGLVTLFDTATTGSWNSGDVSIATVNTTGDVFGVNPGTVTISYTTSVSSCSLSAVRTVTVTAVPSAGTITGPITVCVSSTTIYTVSATGGTWSSSATLIATVGAGTGVLTANSSAGNTTLSYTVTTGCTVSSTLNVTVNPYPTVTPITGPNAVQVGYTITLADTTSGGVWSSANTGTATVNSSGVVTGVSIASVLISYTKTVGGCATSVTKNISVVQAPPLITNVAPNIGNQPTSYSGGDTITITGLNFSTSINRNRVWFGATKAPIISATSTQLVVTVPSGALAGPITVTDTTVGYSGTEGLTGTQKLPFLPKYDNTNFINNTINFKPKSDVSISTSGAAITVVFGDLDGDGKSDLVIPNSIGNNIMVYRNKTLTGKLIADSFAVTTTISHVGLSTPINVKLADIDGDGRLDILSSSAGTARFYVYRNTTTSVGNPTFAAGVLFGTVSGSNGYKPMVLAVADFDGDGKPDIAATSIYSAQPTPCISVLRNTSTVGTITTSSFSSPVTFATGVQPLSIVAGDFDGDGKADLAVSCTTSNVISFFRNTASIGAINSSSFASRVDYVTSSVPIDLATADIDGDGKLDILTANNGPGTLTIRRNMSTSGTLLFDSAVNYSSGSSSTSVAIADFNGDGKPDVAVTNSASSTVSLFRNTASSGSITAGSLAAAYTLATPSIPYGVAAGDLDGDGYPDMGLVSVGTPNYLSLYKNYPLPNAGTISGAANVCLGDSTAYTNALSIGTWSVTNPVNASINPTTGVVTGLNAGPDTVVYTVIFGGDTNYARLPVNIAPLPTVAAISGGSAVCVSAFLPLSNATLGGVWSLTNTSLATITTSGLVTGTSPGIDTARYTVTNVYGCITTVIKPFTVQPNPVAGVITGATSVCEASTTALTNVGGDAGGWSSNNTSIASVNSSGVVSGIAGGTTIITYSVVNSCGTATDTAMMTVLPLPNSGSITGASAVCISASIPLTTTGSGGSWSSSNPSLATVNSSGTVTGVAVGNPVISYTASNSCGTSSATFIVNVQTTPSTPTAILGTTHVCVGATNNLVDSVSGGTWGSSVPSVATIHPSTGVVTGLAVGTTTIIYTISNSCGSAFTTRIDTVFTVPATPAAITGTFSVCVTANTTLHDTSSGGVWSSANASIATVHPSTGVVTGVATGVATISYAVTNVCATVAATANMTVNDVPGVPSVIAGPTAVCAGSNALYTDTTAGGTWSSSTPAVATINSATGMLNAIAVGTTIISYTTTNVCGGSSATYSVTVTTPPNANITSTIVPCIGYTGSVTFTGTTADTIGYKIDGGSVIDGIVSGGTLVISTGVITAPHTYTLFNIRNNVCGRIKDTTTTITPSQMQWLGGTTGALYDWNTATNWSCGSVPTVTDNVFIPNSVTYYPTLATSTTGNALGLNIASGAVVTLQTSAQLNVKGSLANSGTVSGNGKLTLNGTSTQPISGMGVVENLELNNTNGANIATASRMSIKNTLTITSGTLTTGDSLALLSDSTLTARIAPIVNGGISGGVKVVQYVPAGRRAWRFISHPFDNFIALSQLQFYIDITGVGGSTNGFTTTGANSPSAFRYNPLIANSNAGSDPGWRAFTSTYSTADSNRFKRYQSIRLFLRGAKGEGLDFATYTPSATTFAMRGAVNQGTQKVILQKGTGAYQDFNMVGNPYASPVNIGEVATQAKLSGNIVGTAFYVWNPYIGTSGNFQTITITTPSSTPYYLQACTGFQVRAAHNGDSLVFFESNKNSTATTSLVRTTNDNVALNIYDANYHLYDMLSIKFNDQATDNEDNDYDAIKFVNSDFNFYSQSADNKMLAIDGRPFTDNAIIPLGINSNYKQDYIIRAEALAIPNRRVMYLHDKLLNKYVLMEAGAEYKFNISADAASQGKNRFELMMKPATFNTMPFAVNMTPNPAKDEVTVAYSANDGSEVNITIRNVSGSVVYSRSAGVDVEGKVTVNTRQLAAGIYLVEVVNGSNKVIQRLIKE